MKITDFLKMVLRQFTKSDKEVLFADWRQELNDNFEKIDTNAQEVNTILESKLEVTNIIEGTNVTLHKDGNNITISATGDVSEQDVIDKIQEHNISPSSHEDLRAKTDLIETTGTDKEFLARDGKYHQIQGGGATIFDVDTYEVFTATEPTSTFTIPLMTEKKIVQLRLEGLEPIKDVDYTIDKTTGVVTLLNHTLQVGESIYYKTLFSAENGVVFDEDEVIEGSAVLKDINGNKIIPMTLTKAVQDDNGKKLNVILDEKMGKVDVVNVDTQVESDGKALNAVQLNPSVDGTLAQQINDLNTQVVGQIILQNGWVLHQGSLNLYKVGNGLYCFNCMIKNGITTGSTVLATLPKGFYPNVNQFGSGTAYTNNSNIQYQITTEGEIKLLESATAEATYTMLRGEYI